MSKRRRDRQPNLPPEAFNAPAAMLQPEKKGATPSATPANRGATATATTTTPAAIDWQKEYGEVLGDLRRTFLIFTFLVLAMIGLSFVIR